jgi:glycosyltransferase involved in cell wall biosynthesis
VEFLLNEIWPALPTSIERRLSLVGRDPPASAHAAAARDSRIAVTGFVPDVRPYLHSASICVCPIRVGGGTRLKVLDGLAMARPLVATSVAVEGLEMVDGKHYLRAETPSEFVAQIRRLEADAELRQRIGTAGRCLVVDRYDWRVIGRKLDALLERSAHRALTNRRAVG